jgi:hypothetical protein
MSRFLRLDHVGIVGTDLSLLETTYRRLGFSVTQAQPLVRPDPATGVIRPLGQSSQHLVFRTGYVELTAITDRKAGNHLEPFVAKYHGVHIIALGVADAESTWASLGDSGVDAAKPMPLTRDVLYGSGGVAGFKWFPIAEQATPEAYICAVEHLTPEIVFQEAVQNHGNGALALSSVMVGVESLDEARPRFEAMLGASSRVEGDTATMDITDQQVVLFTRDGAASRFPGVLTSSWPRVIGFTIDVADLKATIDLLERQGVPLGRTEFGCWIKPEEAAGSVVAFREA